MAASFKSAFRGVRSILVQRIDVSNGLLDELRDRNVLTDRHVHNIQLASLTEFERAEKLLDILERRSDKLLHAFKEALIATDQQDIWDDFLSSAVAVIPVHMNVISTSQLPANFDSDFSAKLLAVANLLRRHIQRAEINSLRAQLSNTDLDEFERDLLKSELDEKIEDALRQGYNVDPCVMRQLKVSCRFMLVYGAEPVFAQPTHSVVIFLLCRSVEGVTNVGKMVRSGVLRRLLHGAVKEHLEASIDFNVEIRLDPGEYQSALTCFDSQPADATWSTGGTEIVRVEASSDLLYTSSRPQLESPRDHVTALDPGEQLTRELGTETETETTKPCSEQTTHESEVENQLRLDLEAARTEIADLRNQLLQQRRMMNELSRRNAELGKVTKNKQQQFLQSPFASVYITSDKHRQFEAISIDSETQEHHYKKNLMHQQMPFTEMWQPHDIKNLLLGITDHLLAPTINNQGMANYYSLSDGLKMSLMDDKTKTSNLSDETYTHKDLVNLCRLMLTSSKKKQAPIIDLRQNKIDPDAIVTNVINKPFPMQLVTSYQNMFSLGSAVVSNLTEPGLYSRLVDGSLGLGTWGS